MNMLRVWPIVCEFGVGAVLCFVGIWCGLRGKYLDMKVAEDRRLLATLVAGPGFGAPDTTQRLERLVRPQVGALGLQPAQQPAGVDHRVAALLEVEIEVLQLHRADPVLVRRLILAVDQADVRLPRRAGLLARTAGKPARGDDHPVLVSLKRSP